MSRFSCFLALPLAFLIAACSACTPAQPSSSVIGPSWRDEYTHNAPQPGVNTILAPYYIDKRFSAQRKDQIKLACEHWNVVLNGRFRLTYARDVDFSDPAAADNFETQHELSDALPFFFVWEDATDPMLPAGALAYVTELGDPVVHLIDGRLNFTFSPEIVVMHELGHSMGLEHVDPPDTLMSRAYNRQPHCIDEYTVKNLAVDHGWEWRTLNWCEPK